MLIMVFGASESQMKINIRVSSHSSVQHFQISEHEACRNNNESLLSVNVSVIKMTILWFLVMHSRLNCTHVSHRHHSTLMHTTSARTSCCRLRRTVSFRGTYDGSLRTVHTIINNNTIIITMSRRRQKEPLFQFKQRTHMQWKYSPTAYVHNNHQ